MQELADASHRLEDRPLLLRSYQALVVDEAHKLPDAARQMYTETLSSRAMDELCLLLQQAHYKDFARQLRTARRKQSRGQDCGTQIRQRS